MVKFAEQMPRINACAGCNENDKFKGKSLSCRNTVFEIFGCFSLVARCIFFPHHCVSRHGFINTELGASGQISLGCAIQNVA